MTRIEDLIEIARNQDFPVLKKFLEDQAEGKIGFKHYDEDIINIMNIILFRLLIEKEGV